MTILVTGGAGFIGQNFIRQYHSPNHVINLDILNYAADRDFVASSVATFIQGDIADQDLLARILRQYGVQQVVHFAAQTHVDRSLACPDDFVQTNVLGTVKLLEAVTQYWHEQGSPESFRFLHVSTDEVYGSVAHGVVDERAPLLPNSPYAASKAAADGFVRAWYRSYGLPVLISRCSNNYGPHQFPEKLIPLIISRALSKQPLPIYGNGLQVRDWLHVYDHCLALTCLLERGEVGEIYNIGADNHWDNLSLVRYICTLLDELKPMDRPYADLIEHVTDRAGHDQRYAVNSDKIRALGWQPTISFEQGIKALLKTYLSK